MPGDRSIGKSEMRFGATRLKTVAINLTPGRDAADDGGCIEWLEGGLFIEKAQKMVVVGGGRTRRVWPTRGHA